MVCLNASPRVEWEWEEGRVKTPSPFLCTRVYMADSGVPMKCDMERDLSPLGLLRTRACIHAEGFVNRFKF